MSLTDEKYLYSVFIDVNSDLLWLSERVRLVIFPYLKKVLYKNGNDILRELLDRFTTGIASNLFTSRETEAQQRIELLKRLCVAVVCIPPVVLQTFWPQIQERISELLKTLTGPTSFHIFIFLKFSLFGVGEGSVHSIIALLHPTIMDSLTIASESSDLSDDQMYLLTGVFCFLDCLYLLHRDIALAYLWGICSPSSNDSILTDIARKHQLSKSNVMDIDPLDFLLEASKPANMSGFHRILYGLRERTIKYRQNNQFTKADIERLILRSVQELH
jgi:hypothetical protein